MKREVPQGVPQGKIHSVKVPINPQHRLLLLHRELDWTAIHSVMKQHLRMSGCNVDGVLRGRRMCLDLYVPMFILMLVLRLNYREMENLMAENAVARVFLGLEDSPQIQVRDHSTIARIGQSLGAEGYAAINAQITQQAVQLGFADPSVLSADTTAQQLSIGYPHEAGILRGLGQRCIRACGRLKKAGRNLGSEVLDHATTLLKKAKHFYLFAKTPEERTETVRAMVRKTDLLLRACDETANRLETAGDSLTQSAVHTFKKMVAVGRELLPQISSWLDTGKVARGKILHVGLPIAHSMVRNKPGKKVEFGLKQLIMVIGGGYLMSKRIEGHVSDMHMPKVTLEVYRDHFGSDATPELYVYDRGAWSKENIRNLQAEGVSKIGIQPRGRSRWRVHGQDRERVMTERACTEGKIGTLKTAYGMDKPRERLCDTVLATTPRSVTAFNINKLTNDLEVARGTKAA